MEQISQSLPLLLRAIELRPGDPETYFLVIKLLIAIGDDVQQAREVARRAAAKRFARASSSLPVDIPDRLIIDIELTIVKYIRTVYP